MTGVGGCGENEVSAVLSHSVIVVRKVIYHCKKAYDVCEESIEVGAWTFVYADCRGDFDYR